MGKGGRIELKIAKNLRNPNVKTISKPFKMTTPARSSTSSNNQEMNCCDWLAGTILFVFVFGTGHFVLVSYLLTQLNYMPCEQFYYLVSFLAKIIGLTVVGALSLITVGFYAAGIVIGLITAVTEFYKFCCAPQTAPYSNMAKTSNRV